MPARFVALFGLVAICATASAQDKAPPAATTSPASFDRPVTPDQPGAQRRLQGETEQVARRLGTMIRFQRAGVEYTVLGSLPASTVQAAARGL